MWDATLVGRWQLTALTTAELSILMLPLDVGNRAACEKAISASACNFTMPMRELWFTVYMVMAILVVFVIPFTLFYYEADSDRFESHLVNARFNAPTHCMVQIWKSVLFIVGEFHCNSR